MKHWTEWVAQHVATDQKNRETIEAFLSAVFNAMVIGLILWMMIARSCDVCYEMKILNLTQELRTCQSGYSNLKPMSPFENITIDTLEIQH